MTLQKRIETLEKSMPPETGNPYTDWTDEDLSLSIELLGKELKTGQKQEWPEELAKKQAALPCTPSELDYLSDEELETKIIRLEKELSWSNKWTR
ncbi:MAG: hypothetical protein PHW39_02895 [Syntrophomonadaceae bacterium]|jgi:hypothetical protein|nr:hypothetical protein [Clostridia bacterium]MDD4562009.1 hypothetical protein [Syntrophomonadaceae bacterium]